MGIYPFLYSLSYIYVHFQHTLIIALSDHASQHPYPGLTALLFREEITVQINSNGPIGVS
jgi:hypothetical protein